MAQTAFGEAFTAQHTHTETSARIAVQGLEKPLRVLHITDLHLNLHDERDEEHVARLEGRHKTFLEHRFVDQLRALIAEFPEIQPDLVALTGDIIHFPSAKNIDVIRDELHAAGVPWYFLPGNHDYLWPYLSGGGHADNQEELRAEWLDTLRPLTDGENPMMRSRVVNGLRFVALDNSIYLITPEQHQFFKDEAAKGEPVVLLVHIPLYAPALREVAVQYWKPHSLLVGDTYWTAEERRGWGAPLADTPETLAFVETVKSTPNLVAVLAGHVHFAHAEQIGPNAYQYVGRPPFDRLGHRVLDFVPMSGDAAEDAD